MKRLPIRMVEKPWGKDLLPEPFLAPLGQRIGEVWFEPLLTCVDLLVKYIFTSEALSVQVHPSDAQTEALGQGRQGKEECWLVIAADPGARIGIGFTETISAERLAAAALDGGIEAMLRWFPVQAGDFFYIPANTVHAIGAGVSLIEVQQNSDITYRLYDYGRPRELHLEAGVAVARGEVYDTAFKLHLAGSGQVCLVDGPYFRLDRLDGAPDAGLQARYKDQPIMVIASYSALELQNFRLECGEVAVVDSLAQLNISAGQCCLIAQSIT